MLIYWRVTHIHSKPQSYHGMGQRAIIRASPGSPLLQMPWLTPWIMAVSFISETLTFPSCLPDVYQLHPVTRTRRFLHRYGFHPPFDRFLGETIGFPFGTPQFFFALRIEDLCRRFRPTAATRRPCDASVAGLLRWEMDEKWMTYDDISILPSAYLT